MDDAGVDALAGDLEAIGVRVERADEVRAMDGAFAGAVRRLAARPPDLLHVHLPWPHANAWLPMAARLAGVRAVVATEHLLFPETHRRDDLRKRALARFVDRTIAVSEGIAATLVGRWGFARSRVVVVPNGVDARALPGSDAAARARGRAALGVPDAAILVGSVGRLEEQKGFAHLVRAAGRVGAGAGDGAPANAGALHVAIAGEGSLAAALRDEAERAGLGRRLHLPGRVAAVADFLAALDLFVLPSLWEGMPLSLLEAMAMGIPCVATATPGAVEVLDGAERPGVLVAPGDESALAGAIAALLADRAEARRLGDAGRARVRERHDAERLFERTLAVYDAVAPAERRAAVAGAPG
jgi:glycosyltransferase involved in cell wall biosynthesis